MNKKFIYIILKEIKTLPIAYTIISLLFPFNGHFAGGPGLAGTRMFPFWILLELKVLEVLVTSGAIRRAKLQSNYHHQHPVVYIVYANLHTYNLEW